MAKVVTFKQKIEERSEAEKENISLAIKDYEETNQLDPLTEKAYDRLKILTEKIRIIKKNVS